MNEATFTNEAVDATALPQANNLAYEPLAPTYARTMIIEWCASWLFIAAVYAGVKIFTSLDIPILHEWWLPIILALLLLSVFVWAPLVARSRGFSLRERDLHYQSGIIWQKTVSLPFNRIQHVELESGPLERFFKLTTLKFFTAGGGSSDMKIPALTFERASKLRTYVIEKSGVDETDTESTAHDID